MGGFMENEFTQWLFQAGGTSGIILLGMWKMWNGTSKKITETNKIVHAIDKRLVAVETKLGD